MTREVQRLPRGAVPGTGTLKDLGRRRFLAAAVVAVPGGAVLAACSGSDDGSSSAATTSETSSASAPAEAVAYQDGEYSADGVYGSGPSSIGVTVTLADDVVTAVAVETHATNATSLDYQQRFADGVPEVVVGQRLEDVEVGIVAGSSSTPDGFNAAIDQIREQAAV